MPAQTTTPNTVPAIKTQARNPKYHSMFLESVLGVPDCHKAVLSTYKQADTWTTLYRLPSGLMFRLVEDRVKRSITVTELNAAQMDKERDRLDGLVAAVKLAEAKAKQEEADRKAQAAAEAAAAATPAPQPTPDVVPLPELLGKRA